MRGIHLSLDEAYQEATDRNKRGLRPPQNDDFCFSKSNHDDFSTSSNNVAVPYESDDEISNETLYYPLASRLELLTRSENCKASSVIGIGHYSIQNRPKFHRNEDVILQDASLFGVIDGHDGSFAAEYVKRHLKEFIPRERDILTFGDFDLTRLDCDLFHLTIGSKRPYPNYTFRDLLPHSKSVSPLQSAPPAIRFVRPHSMTTDVITSPFAPLTSQSSGACVIASFVYSNCLVTINLGDCRAVWIPLEMPTINEETSSDDKTFNLDKDNFVWMSRDMKASEAYESRRIKAIGGEDVIEDGRIGGILEPSRSIGDFDLKESYSYTTISGRGNTYVDAIISTRPEVRFLKLPCSDDEESSFGLLLSATDGVWDGLSPMICDNICNILNDKFCLNLSLAMRRKDDVQSLLNDASREIVLYAVNQGFSDDDCTCQLVLIEC